ncbi:putative nucleotidyltransferase/HEPN domain-containing protein [Azospirillum lipoferum]|nr:MULTISPECIES: HEPN domain-containing protein [Azospirillum]MCP1608616.1 putative nucleotidyltransferase/HEPN domain-containing protein [Azospirillum lipoferum]MDW5536066.1 HEPN domain-containing protein [Azospirillum sp. NL1]
MAVVDARNDEKLQILLDRIVPTPEPEAVYLFGSRARGDFHEDSDCDLLVIVPDDAPKERRSIRYAYASKIGTGIRRTRFPAPAPILSDTRIPWGRSVTRPTTTAYGSMDTDVVRTWIAVADRDLAMIRKAIAGPDPEPAGAAFHCQQAAEKLIEAVLVAAGIHPPRSHDLRSLIDRLPADHGLREVLLPLQRFTALAVAYRYPTAHLFDDPPDEPTVEEVADWLVEIGTLRTDVIRFLGIP